MLQANAKLGERDLAHGFLRLTRFYSVINLLRPMGLTVSMRDRLKKDEGQGGHEKQQGDAVPSLAPDARDDPPRTAH